LRCREGKAEEDAEAEEDGQQNAAVRRGSLKAEVNKRIKHIKYTMKR
jgi:hypothetical protein